MLEIFFIFFGCHLIVFGATVEHVKEKETGREIPFLDKFQQHDYNITFERIELARYDKTYMKKVNFVTFKYNRTCALVNSTFIFNVNVGNKMEMVVQMYKFASNEYRMFPIRFEINFCKAVTKNIFGLGNFGNCGNFTVCHLMKGVTYNNCNWVPDSDKFPPLITNGHYMAEMQFLLGI